jgi:cellulose biosynthesis protein BcsQ
MVDARKRLHREIMDALSSEQDVLTTAIPSASDVERMGVHRTVVDLSAPRRSAARAYRALWREICEQLAAQSPAAIAA